MTPVQKNKVACEQNTDNLTEKLTKTNLSITQAATEEPVVHHRPGFPLPRYNTPDGADSHINYCG
jgi:hypothetical protein